MHLTAPATSDGVSEQRFVLGDIPGALWTPVSAGVPRPLVLLGHGGGAHKAAADMVEIARRLVIEHGFTAVAIDAPSHGDRPDHEEFTRIATEYEIRLAAGETLAPLIASFQSLVAREIVPEWQAALDAVQLLSHVGHGPVGYWGLSLGTVIGAPLVAAEPRVRAAVLGLAGAEVSAAVAARITVPVEFLVQLDDERVPRLQALALFDALASAEKTLHANPGKHGAVPGFEIDATLRFLARHLS